MGDLQAALRKIRASAKQSAWPMVVFSLPGSSEIQLIIQKGTDLKGDAPSGFVITPFSPNERHPRMVLNPDVWLKQEAILDYANSIEEVQILEEDSLAVQPTTKEDYIAHVEKLISAIQAGQFEKAIAWRKKVVELPNTFGGIELFLKAAEAYPNTFSYFISIPNIGEWMGATPELLLESSNGNCQTVSLAGTRPIDVELVNPWGEKERQEQQMVSDFIADRLKGFAQGSLHIKGPETVSAGKVQHLKTKFSFEKKATVTDSQIAEAIHPTPAVGGLPREAALEFIQKHEPTIRAYYTGYLGLLNMDGGSKLYVNLRCGELVGNQLVLYLGGGITAPSKPALEWAETELKATTLLNLLPKNTDL